MVCKEKGSLIYLKEIILMVVILLFYLKGYDEVNIIIEIKFDDIFEVVEVFIVNFVNVFGVDRL